MAKNRLQDLRDHLFETLERLKDDDKPMEVERARAVADVAHAIINSAKLEIRFLEVTGQDTASEFVGETPKRQALPTPTQENRESAEATSSGARVTKGPRCLDCGELFPDAKALGIHRTRVHFGTASLNRGTLSA